MAFSKSAVFISGGTSGIGLALVEKYLQEGYFVVINYCKGGKSITYVEKLLKKKSYSEKEDYLFLKADVGTEENLTQELKKLPKDILKNVEILINNAAVLKRGDLSELSQSDWNEVFDVNVFGVINLSKFFTKNSKKLKNIINIGSIRGFPAISRPQNIAYSISKSTIPTLTGLMAKSLGPSVRVNAIIPGTIDTSQRQGISADEMDLYGEKNAVIKRLGKPAEIADLCFFITSVEGSYITGSFIVIDGGYSVNYIR